MSKNPKPSPETAQEFKILGAFASVVGLLSIGLYFTGWIYRWAYFGSFQIELTRLSFPAESFFFTPIQVFLGSARAFSQAVMGMVITVALVRATLWLLQPASATVVANVGSQHSLQVLVRRFSQRLHRSWVAQRLRAVAASFPIPLPKDLMIVAWILSVLFWLARWQGVVDAQRDMRIGSSSLPVIALLQPEKEFGLGRNLKDSFVEPSLEKTRLIGDVGLFEQLRTRDVREPGDPAESGDWHLLINSSGWLYMFRTLPASSVAQKRRPLVLAVREGGGQMMILSPTASEP